MTKVLMWVEKKRDIRNNADGGYGGGKMQQMHHNDSIAGTFNGITGMRREMYSYLVAVTTDEALVVVVEAVESGDGIETLAELHKRYNQKR